jgi:hypothetical protein
MLLLFSGWSVQAQTRSDQTRTLANRVDNQNPESSARESEISFPRPGTDPLDALVPQLQPTRSRPGVQRSRQATSPSSVQVTGSLPPSRPNVTRSRIRESLTLQTPAALTPVIRQPVATLPDPEPPPAAPRRRRPESDDPYAPLGIDLDNGLILRPSLQQDAGYDSNPDRISAATRKGSLLSRTEAGLGVESNWSRHSLNGQIRGAYTAFPDNAKANRPDAEGRLGLRLDLTREARIDSEVRFKIDTQRPGSPELGGGVRNRPLTTAYGASLGGTQAFNRLQVSVRGDADRFSFEDAKLANGQSLDQGDRMYNQYGARARIGYEATPGLIPFAEALTDTRLYDRSIDSTGFRRDSTSFAGRAGSTFEITRTLTGEASAGYRVRDYEDVRLRNTKGVIADASLIWSASALTTLRLRGASEIDETSLANASGVLTRVAALEVSHDFRRWLTGTAGIAFSQLDYQGIRLREDGLAARIGLEYKFTRELAARATFLHERLKSTAPNADYTANSVLLGVRLQR